MAQLAADPSAGGHPEFIRLLRPYPGRLAYALRLAAICALTALVTSLYGTPQPALTIYLVFFLNRIDRTTSLIMNLALVVVMTLAIGIVFLLAMVVLDDAMWRVLSMAGISFALLFLVSASKLRPVGGTLALIVAYAMDLLGNIQIGEEVTRGLLYAWLFAGIPAGVSIVLNLAAGPAPRRLAERAIARRLELCAALLHEPGEELRREFEECLGEGIAEIQHWLKLAGVEKTASTANIAALQQAASSCVVLLNAVALIDRTRGTRPDADSAARLRQVLLEMAQILNAGSYPLEIGWPLSAQDEAGLTPLSARVLNHLKEALQTFAEQPPRPVQTPAPAAKAKSGFLAADAFTNPDHVHYALKTTVAAMICYCLYSLLDWPGIHTCLITCYIVSLGTAAESVEKLSLRILGCLIGAAMGLATMIFVVPSLTTVGGLMAIVFVGTLIAAWAAVGSPRIAYAGFQIGFAFLLCVIQGAGPSFDMVTARDRVVGILVGNLVVYLLATRWWPVSVARRVDPALVLLLRRLQELAVAGDAPARIQRATEAQAALTAWKADLGLVRYEPLLIRPVSAWREARREAARAISLMVPPLLLSAGHEPDWDRAVGRRIGALASRLSGSPPVEPTSAWSSAQDDDPLQNMVEHQLRELERFTPEGLDQEQGHERYAPV